MKVIIITTLLVFSLVMNGVCVANTISHKISDSINGRIIGGQNTTPHQYPWQVSLRYHDTMSGWVGHNCGGVILNENWILSAAHCFAQTGAGFYEVWAGKHNLQMVEQYEQIRLAQITVLHPKYDPMVTGPFDIALLRINTPLEFNPAIKPIKLRERKVYPQGDVIISGWGSKSNTEFLMPNVLYSATVGILPFKKCAELLQETLFNVNNFCTGPLEGGVATCAGDNGGGVVQENNGEFQLIGIVSWGWFPCALPGRPMVHENVSVYINWIREIINSFA